MKYIFLTLFLTSSIFARDLSFLTSMESNEIVIGDKKFNEFNDRIFKDKLGRERYFRGWNTSNSFKGPPYHPNLSPEDLNLQIKKLKETQGSNLIRYLILWAAIHPQVDVIDYNYLQRTTEVLKKLIARDMHILLDWHQDLFSMGNDGKWQAGDGPPEWIVQGMHLPSGSCGLICLSWSQNYVTNRAIKTALRHFWNNEKVDTTEGKRNPQDEFIWSMKIALDYFKNHLSPKEFSYIIGIDPWNEPVEGGLKKYEPKISTAEWHNQKLWPFYKKIRAMTNTIGYANKPIFAEPATFWNIKLPLIAARGGGFLKDIPKEGFVFNAHIYDEVTEAFGDIGKIVQNGAYLKYLDQFRTEARYLNMPPIATEYGAWDKKKAFDASRIIKATYQGMEYSLTERKKRNRYIDFYSPLISGTQWVYELSNGGYAGGDCDKNIIERAYPRAVSGDIMHFVYKSIGHAAFDGIPLDWETLRIQGKYYFENNKFLWLVWRGKSSSYPTEVYIPRHFNLETTLVMTENKIIYNLKDNFTSPTGEANEIFQQKDLNDADQGGTRIFVYNEDENQKKYHYLLVVDLETQTPDFSILDELQHKIDQHLKGEKSPIYLKGKIKIRRPKIPNPNAK